MLTTTESQRQIPLMSAIREDFYKLLEQDHGYVRTAKSRIPRIGKWQIMTKDNVEISAEDVSYKTALRAIAITGDKNADVHRLAHDYAKIQIYIDVPVERKADRFFTVHHSRQYQYLRQQANIVLQTREDIHKRLQEILQLAKWGAGLLGISKESMHDYVQ